MVDAYVCNNCGDIKPEEHALTDEEVDRKLDELVEFYEEQGIVSSSEADDIHR